MVDVKKQILFALLIIAAIVAFRLHTPPDVPLPKSARVQGGTVTIPVTSHVNPQAVQYAGLARQSGSHYAVVLKSGNVIREFPAGSVITRNKDGVDYKASGQIHLSGRPYQAQQLHVDADGRKGYIVFKQIPS